MGLDRGAGNQEEAELFFTRGGALYNCFQVNDVILSVLCFLYHGNDRWLAEVLGRAAGNDWWALTRFVEGQPYIPFLEPFRTDWYPLSGIGQPYLEEEGNGVFGFWWLHPGLLFHFACLAV